MDGLGSEVVGGRCQVGLVVKGAASGSLLKALLREVGAEIPKYDRCLLSQLLGKAQGLCREHYTMFNVQLKISLKKQA